MLARTCPKYFRTGNIMKRETSFHIRHGARRASVCWSVPIFPTGNIIIRELPGKIIIGELSGNIIIRETIRNHKRIIRHGARRASVRVEVVFKPNCVIKQVKHSFLFFISVSEIYKYTDVRVVGSFLL